MELEKNAPTFLLLYSKICWLLVLLPFVAEHLKVPFFFFFKSFGRQSTLNYSQTLAVTSANLYNILLFISQQTSTKNIHTYTQSRKHTHNTTATLIESDLYQIFSPFCNSAPFFIMKLSSWKHRHFSPVCPSPRSFCFPLRDGGRR